MSKHSNSHWDLYHISHCRLGTIFDNPLAILYLVYSDLCTTYKWISISVKLWVFSMPSICPMFYIFHLYIYQTQTKYLNWLSIPTCYVSRQKVITPTSLQWISRTWSCAVTTCNLVTMRYSKSCCWVTVAITFINVDGGMSTKSKEIHNCYIGYSLSQQQEI